jgi:hypothetical protein
LIANAHGTQSRAKAREVKFGRKPKLTQHQQAEAVARIAQGETLTAVARTYNVSQYDDQSAGGCGLYAIANAKLALGNQTVWR